MMPKKEIGIGIIVSLIITFCGTLIMFYTLTPYKPMGAYIYLKQTGFLGKYITLASLVNLLVFFVLLKLNKDEIAKGVVIALVLTVIFTFLI